MIFTFPAGFLLLGLIPVVILLHSLKPKARPIFSTTVYLWQKAHREQSAGLRLKRLRRNIPLLMQLLVITLAAIALANPILPGETSSAANMILIVDTSASMQAETGEGSRIAIAREKADQLIRSFSGKGELMIIGAGIKPMIIARFSRDTDALRDAVSELKALDVAGQIKKSIYLALSFMRPDTNDRIVLLTDGAGMDLPEILSIDSRIDPVLIKGGSRNTGITNFTYRQLPDNPGRLEFLVEVSNFNDYPVLCPLLLTLDEFPLDRRTLGLTARQTKRYIVPYEGPQSGKAILKLDLDDDFVLDNSAYAVFNRPQKIYIHLFSKESAFLEKALRAYPGIELNRSADILAGSFSDQVRQHDLVIVNNMEVPVVEQGNLVLINSLSPTLPLTKTGNISSPVVVDWHKNHPLLRDINFAGLIIEQAALVKAGQGPVELISGDQSGLCYSYENERLRILYLGFDLEQTNLPLKVAFPMLVDNILLWTNPGVFRKELALLKTGDPVPLYLRATAKEIDLRTPSRILENLAVDHNPLLFSDTYESGIYRVREADYRFSFAVNLFNKSESDIIPIDLKETQTRSAPLPMSARSGFSPWLILFLLAAVLVIIEWFFWINP